MTGPVEGLSDSQEAQVRHPQSRTCITSSLADCGVRGWDADSMNSRMRRAMYQKLWKKAEAPCTCKYKFGSELIEDREAERSCVHGHENEFILIP